MTAKLNVVDYKDQIANTSVYQGYTATTSSYWITITKNERGTGRETGEVVFDHKLMDDDWLDAAHLRITKALHELEAAIVAAVRKEK